MSDQRQFLEHLIHVGLLDAAQARNVLGMLPTSTSLVELLIENGLVDEVGLARALGGFYNIKAVDMSRVTPRREALDRAHGTFCRRHRLLPFSQDRLSGDLLIAVADPAASRSVLETFRVKTGQKVRPYVAPYRALLRAIEENYFDKRSTESTSLGHRPAQFGMGSREVSTMGAVPGFGESGLGSRAPSPSLSQFVPPPGESSNRSQATTSVDQFFDEDPAGQRGGTAHLADGAGRAAAEGAGAAPDAIHHGSEARGERARQETIELREHIHRLEVSLQLEINLVRQLVEMLLEAGVIDRQTYTAKLGRLR